MEGTTHGQALISADAQMESVELQIGIELVLLVEKEATFQRLYWERMRWS